jgi:hypothetical protein
MRRSLMMILAVLTVGALLTAGCGDDEKKVASEPNDRSEEPDKAAPTPPDDAPTTAGPLASVQPFQPITENCTPPEELDPNGTVSSEDQPICTPDGDDVLGTFLIAPGTGTGEVDAASVTVTKDTELLVADGSGGWEDGRFEDLTAGTKVQTWALDGMMAESYPVQFEAEAVAYEPAAAGPGDTAAPPVTGPTSTVIVDPPITGPADPSGLPTVAPTSAGTVTSAEPCPPFDPTTPGTCADKLVATVLIDTATGSGPELDARITTETVILVHDGTRWTNGSVNDVKAGATARVWVDGDRLTKSIPAQGQAATIAIGPLDR